MATEISQGRQMNDEHIAFSAYLISLFKPKDSKDFDNIIAKLSEKEISDLYKQFKTMEGVTFAKMGAKLDYLQRLNGRCPEGYEIERYMAGGCVKCKKKLLQNTPLMDKCGGRVKKRISKSEKGSKVKSTGWTNTDGGYESIKTNSKGKVSQMVSENGTTYARGYDGKQWDSKKNPEKVDSVRRADKHGFAPNEKRRIKKDEKGGAFKRIEGGPGMADSTRGAKLNPRQSKATKGKKRI